MEFNSGFKGLMSFVQVHGFGGIEL